MNGLTRISSGHVGEAPDAVEQSELGASNTVAGVAEDAVAAPRVSVVTARRGVLTITMVQAGAGTAQTMTMMTLSMRMMMMK